MSRPGGLFCRLVCQFFYCHHAIDLSSFLTLKACDIYIFQNSNTFVRTLVVYDVSFYSDTFVRCLSSVVLGDSFCRDFIMTVSNNLSSV